MLEVSADSVLLPNTVLSLHPHPLLLVDLLRRAGPSAEAFGFSKSFACKRCNSLGYRFLRYCASCSDMFCQKCFQAASDDQDAVLRFIIDEELAAQATRDGVLTSPTHRRAPDAVGVPPIFGACADGDLAEVKAIVEKNEFSNTLDIEQVCEAGPHKGKTLLLIAAEFGHREIAVLLTSRGAKTETCDLNGMTPLMHAAYGGHIGVLDELLFAGVNVTRAAFCGYSPIHLAANKGYHEVIQRLLAAGARLSCRTPGGRTPLIIAAFNGHLETVEMLLHLSNDDDVQTTDTEGYSALHAAISMGHRKVELCVRKRLARIKTKEPTVPKLSLDS